MRILALEPYYGGSHKSFVKTLQKNSRHEILAETMPPRFWKWRLSGAPFLFADKFKKDNEKLDLLLFSNAIDVAAFVALAGHRAAQLPKVTYFHENQIVYPLSEHDQPDVHFGMININSAAVSDAVWFNSDFHRRTFLDAIDPFLSQFPDFVPTHVSGEIEEKSSVMPIPIRPLPEAEPVVPKGNALRILWNHRWEYDKAPEVFFEALELLAASDVDFEVVVLGEGFRSRPPIFDRSREKLGDRVARYGYVQDRSEYNAWVRSCDVIVSCARQEYFGISVAEAVLAGCFPILPDRLVYPEFIPKDKHKQHLYRNNTELVDMLRQASLNLDTLRNRERLDYYDNYTVDKVIQRFDEEVEKVVNGGSST